MLVKDILYSEFYKCKEWHYYMFMTFWVLFYSYKTYKSEGRKGNLCMRDRTLGMVSVLMD